MSEGRVCHLRLGEEPTATMMGTDETQVLLTLASHLTMLSLRLFIHESKRIIPTFAVAWEQGKG